MYLPVNARWLKVLVVISVVTLYLGILVGNRSSADKSAVCDSDMECSQLDLNAVKVEVEDTEVTTFVCDAEITAIKKEDVTSTEFTGVLMQDDYKSWRPEKLY